MNMKLRLVQRSRKTIDMGMVIDNICLHEKSGGRRGHYKRVEQCVISALNPIQDGDEVTFFPPVTGG